MLKRISNILNLKEDQLKKYAFNSFWMVFEKIFRLLVNLVVGIWIARYLGPEQFGIFNYAIALAALFLPLINFGLHGILVKEIFQLPNEEKKILGSSFTLKFFLSLLVIALFTIVSFIGVFENTVETKVVLIVSLSLIAQPFLVLEPFFEAKVSAKTPSVYKSVFFGISSGLKILAILLDKGIIVLAWIYSMEAILVALSVVLAYKKSGNSIFKWRFNLPILLGLIKKSWLLVFSSISAVIYLKIDQVMLSNMVSNVELGFYSSAVRLSEAWYFLPFVVSSSLFPAILSSKQKGEATYYRRLQQLCDLYFILSFGLALIVAFTSDWIIELLYGIEFLPGGIILQIHIWASIFIFLRSVLSKWLIAEDLYVFSLVSQLSGAVTNVVLNIILIPKLGGVGAAIATVISYAVASMLVLVFFHKTRKIFFMFLWSMTAPLRIIKLYEKAFKKI